MEAYTGSDVTISAKTVRGLYSQWAHEEGERAQSSVTRLSNVVVHYGLADFVDENVRDELRFSRKNFLLRMGQLLPRREAFSKPSHSQWVPSEFVPRGKSFTIPSSQPKVNKIPTHRPRPAPCGRPIPRPADVFIARQGSDRKCALWALQGAVQEAIDFEPFLNEGAAITAIDDVHGSGAGHHGEGGDWSLTAIARALSRQGLFVFKHVGDKLGLFASNQTAAADLFGA